MSQKRIDKIILKIFFVILYIIFGSSFIYITFNNSFWLIDNGNSGFVGQIIYSFIFENFPLVKSTYTNLILILLTILFFFLASDLNLKKILISSLKLLIESFRRKSSLSENYESENFKTEKLGVMNERPQQSFVFEQSNKNERINKINFQLPSIDFLEKNQSTINRDEILKKMPDSTFMEKILLDFGVNGKIKKISNGPVVSLYEFEPAPGVKVSKIINLSDDIARNTSSTSARVSVIPGKNTVGIEIPNDKRENVVLREIISNDKFLKKEIKLPLALGKNISGAAVIGDLSSMPHLLIAGTTGSGKSVCINTIIVSLLYRLSPEICKFILIDPKMLELTSYEDIPHLLTPVITDAKKATTALGWTVKEMNNRYKLMSKVGVRNIDGYNEKHKLKMPYIVVVVDEMSDLMLVAGKEIENYIQKLSQMARAAGIHIIMATQRPSVDVITGTIKANFPTRVSFQSKF